MGHGMFCFLMCSTILTAQVDTLKPASFRDALWMPWSSQIINFYWCFQVEGEICVEEGSVKDHWASWKHFPFIKKKKKGGGRQGASKSKHFRRQLFPLYSRKLAFPKTMEYKTGVKSHCWFNLTEACYMVSNNLFLITGQQHKELWTGPSNPRSWLLW